MDFEDTPEEADFRAEVRAWLAKTAPAFSGGVGGLMRSVRSPEELAKAKQWQAQKAEARYAKIMWPKEYGGMDGTPIQNVIYAQEEAKYDVPNGPFVIGLGMCIPTVIAHGSEADRARYVEPALHGREIWCQLFSEPAAGSDLAGIRTRAERDGDDWIINGQKIWTSGAHYSDFGILVTRSDPGVAKHKGLTFFYLDMKSPGVEIKPIRQISGASNFNEVYFTDVRIPDSQRLGAPGQGWQVSLTTLMNERAAIGGADAGLGIRELIELARSIELPDGPAIKNAAVREKIADWHIQAEGLKYTGFRSITALSKGQTPGPENSITKAVSAARGQDLAAFAMELMEMGGILRDDALVPYAAGFQEQWISSPASRIAGGTDEILRNIIAERVLGLPGEIRVDKDIPFNELPTGAG
ncbi:MAG TPA: acyl-CoA dehydrogenase [Alphaproteobacteria bacterium]|jgi:acyl-CoA dehydrogenase|nr:acyl-CoA dehydrogenase [Alphaproteobacteria bacterium]HCO90281.1 acyl-CoA dehydrogenase [Alphaproteobacteria bacterium]